MCVSIILLPPEIVSHPTDGLCSMFQKTLGQSYNRQEHRVLLISLPSCPLRVVPPPIQLAQA